VVSSTPRPHFTPGKDSVPIVQEAGWALGPVWTGGKSRPHRDSIPERPARSQSLYRLRYPAHYQGEEPHSNYITKNNGICVLMTISRQGLLFHNKASLLDNIIYSGYYCVQLRLKSLTLNVYVLV